VQTPHVFIAYAPRGAGLRCAVAYLAGARDAYGWFAGPRHDGSIAAAYFLLEDCFTNRETRYEAVEQTDLHRAWGLDEARRHELARLQEVFARAWLFYRDAPQAAAELQAYAEAELAAGELNVRFERLAKFSTQQPNWTYYSANFERPVLRSLIKHWPLEYRMDFEPAERRTARSCP
jgi:hypothetical protein